MALQAARIRGRRRDARTSHASSSSAATARRRCEEQEARRTSASADSSAAFALARPAAHSARSKMCSSTSGSSLMASASSAGAGGAGGASCAASAVGAAGGDCADCARVTGRGMAPWQRARAELRHRSTRPGGLAVRYAAGCRGRTKFEPARCSSCQRHMFASTQDGGSVARVRVGREARCSSMCSPHTGSVRRVPLQRPPAPHPASPVRACQLTARPASHLRR